MSLVASRLCGRVVAIEPDPSAFDMLRRNAARNGCAVEAHRVAVADRRGTVALAAHEQLGDSRTSSFGDAAAFHAEAVLLDDLRPEPCDLIKMDIEGAEAWVLAGYTLPCPLWLSTHAHLIPEGSADDYEALLDDFLGRHSVVRHVGLDVLVEPR